MTISINKITPKFMEEHTTPLNLFKGWEEDSEKGRIDFYKDIKEKSFTLVESPEDFKCEVEIVKHSPEEYWVRYEGYTTWDIYVKDVEELKKALNEIVVEENKKGDK